MPGVYISYPFCAQKCTYCNFASGVFPKELERGYLDALLDEIRAHEWQWQPDTVYLGGGTPSEMDLADLSAVLSAIPSGGWREATIESAPGGITAAKAAGWARGGINRVSLGVQSFEQRELARTGRKHTADIVAREIETLRSNGIVNINVDLIAGLPGQTAASWRTSLQWIEKLSPPHVSVYMLEVDEDSRLGNEVLLNGKRYGAPEVPGDERIAEFYETAVEELARLGIQRYEISNFARPGFESLHNLKYWRLEPYAGFGSDAHSFDGCWRYQNVERAREYVSEMRNRGSARVETTAANLQEEKFFVGLRLSQGIRPAASEWDLYAKPIERFLAEGLLERTGDVLKLTDRGVLVSNEVFAEFLAA
jgi:putative oxygen-independent coproporphyrinogen III oxidase